MSRTVQIPSIERGVIIRGPYVRHQYGVHRVLVAGKVDAQAVIKWYSVRRGCWQYDIMAIRFIARLIVSGKIEIVKIK